MALDFDRVIERRGTDAAKFADLAREYGNGDVIPLSVADMDFAVFPPILEAMQARLSQEIFGYHTLEEPAKEAICRWYAGRHQLTIAPETVAMLTNVVSGFNLGVQVFSQPGDQIVVQPPVYGPFYLGPQHDRRVVHNPLKKVGDSWKMDFIDLERHFKAGARVMILCNPHNPVGRSWRPEELGQLAKLCQQYGVLVLSDEIHGDLTMPDYRHTPILSVPGMEQHAILFSSASKTFNLAGLSTAFAVILDEGLRKRFTDALRVVHAGSNIFGLVALQAAFDQCAPLLDELLQYLHENLHRTCVRINAISGLHTRMPEATYLLFIDCAGLGVQDPHRLIAQAGVGLNKGSFFGEDYSQYVRMNVASPRPVLMEALDRLSAGLVRNR